LAVRLIIEIEKLYKKRLPLVTLLQAQTIEALAEVLRRERWTPSWSSLVPLRPTGSKPPLFLMHSHGGNVLEYHALANHLESEQPVYALQARGLDGRIPKDPSLEEMAAAYLDELRTLQPEGPYFLGGFCFGGLLALESAQQLVTAGEEVALVVMIQTMHPGSDPFNSNHRSQQLWHRAVKRIALERENLANRGKRYIYERLQRGLDIVQARTAIAFDSLTGNSRGPHRPMSMSYILESLAIEHDKAFRKYRPQPYGGDVLLIRASKQLPGMAADPYLGWRDVLYGSLDICEASGHQQNMLIGPNVSRLADELSTRLAFARQKINNRAHHLVV
jgi:thioesterase domain-containing protein